MSVRSFDVVDPPRPVPSLVELRAGQRAGFALGLVA
jgi:hypothetical protein